ncbi:hypothetical protein J2S37_000731 [Corynebacterium felinum]|uniref:Uncharacterized protein n=1 Tax=Corynebacterium felinum TaxID=131318 RepID=A0ABU2B8T5_9CORY|nr:hypothetical protein [Corynebacterium felinum]
MVLFGECDEWRFGGADVGYGIRGVHAPTLS